jgi:midasin
MVWPPEPFRFCDDEDDESKPSLRSLPFSRNRPLYVRFLELFPRLFSRTQNAKFMDAVGARFDQKQWLKMTKAMRDAAGRAFDRLDRQAKGGPGGGGGGSGGGAVGEKRPLDDPSATAKRAKAIGEAGPIEGGEAARQDWLRFAAAVDMLEARLKASAGAAVAFAFQEGQLVRAVREGRWLLLDEINLASAETLQRLSGLLEGTDGTLRVIERGDEAPLKRHPDFRIFATMNPPTDAGKKDLPPVKEPLLRSPLSTKCLAHNVKHAHSTRVSLSCFLKPFFFFLFSRPPPSLSL